MTVAVDDLGTGTPVVLLHAGIADRRMWRGQVPALVAAGYRVISLDLPGYGDSPVPDASFGPHEMVVEVLAARGVDRTHVVGCSFGGQVAIDVALARPGLVRSLTLFGPALGGFDLPASFANSWQAAMAGVDDDDLDAVAAAEVRFWVVGEGRATTAVDADLLTFAAAMDRRALEGEAAMDGLVRPLDPPAAGRLGEIGMPVVVTTGAHDRPEFRALADHIAAAVPAGRRLPDIPAAGHLPALDQPAAVTRVLLDALVGSSSG